MIPLTAEQVQLATGASLQNAALYLPFLQVACKNYSITSPRRVAGFLSQIGHESAGLSRLVENLNYSTDGLLVTFSRKRISAEDAQTHGRRRGQPANQVKLANLLYGGAFGREQLGNTQPGDGWAFRGRGLKQLTGRDNYRRCGDALRIDLIGNPDLLLLPANAAMSAGWFWSTNKLNDIADLGDVIGMTRRVNGGVNGLAQREALWQNGLRAFA
jgi:putative chitinase